MLELRIVCIEIGEKLEAVGTGTSPKQADNHWTVAEVRARINAGDRFYIQSPDGTQTDIELDEDNGIRIKHDPERSTIELDSLRRCRSWED